jgi:hypothetical protein
LPPLAPVAGSGAAFPNRCPFLTNLLAVWSPSARPAVSGPGPARRSAWGQGRPVAGRRMAQPVYPCAANTRAFPHLRFVPRAVDPGGADSRALTARADVRLFSRRRRSREHLHVFRKTKPSVLVLCPDGLLRPWERGVGECADSNADQVGYALRLPKDR